MGTVTWPVTGDVVAGLAAFYSSPTLEPDQVRARLRQLLPAYMVPEHLENLAQMPPQTATQGGLREGACNTKCG